MGEVDTIMGLVGTTAGEVDTTTRVVDTTTRVVDSMMTGIVHITWLYFRIYVYLDTSVKTRRIDDIVTFAEDCCLKMLTLEWLANKDVKLNAFYGS